MKTLMATHDQTFSGPDPRRMADLLQETEWVRSLARRLVGDAARADDIAQDAFVAALRAGPAGDHGLRPWLTVVVKK